MDKYQWDSIDPDDLARMRDQRLRKQVRFQLYAYSAFYRRALDDLGVSAGGFAGVADLSKLELVDRDTLASAPEDFLLEPSHRSIQRWSSPNQLVRVALDRLFRGVDHADRELANEYEPVHARETAGSAGEPLTIHLTRRDLAVLATQGKRMLEVAGVKESDVLLNLLEPVASGGFWPVWTGGVSMGIRQIARGPLDPQEAVAVAKRWKTTVVMARAEDALALFDEAGEGGLTNLRLVITAPHPMSPALRRRLMERADPARIVSTYGFAEGRALWAECIEGSGYPDAGFHLSPDLDLIETISPIPSEPLGEVVFTGLDQRGTALARYRPGDVAAGGLAPGRCPYCGRIVDRILGPIVRADNLVQVRLEGERPVAVDVEMLAEALSHPALDSWQVEIAKEDGDPRGADQLFVRYVPRKNKDPAVVAVELDRVLRAEMGLPASQFVLTDDAAGGVIDSRPIPVGSPLNGPEDLEETGHVRLWRTPPVT